MKERELSAVASLSNDAQLMERIRAATVEAGYRPDMLDRLPTAYIIAAFALGVK